VITKFIEATNGPSANWGKFMVAKFGPDDWATQSAISGALLAGRGWDMQHIFVLDLQTGEGAMFRHGGFAKADLDKHKIWVCPLFEPFLEWLYKQDVDVLSRLPEKVDLPNAPFELRGYRRRGEGR
jgi:hypothetical protein